MPDPINTREGTLVTHVIVHHSAGLNTVQNYTEEVRNIYLLHTQSNGWDDIGYNYLIAPNGVIYKGRDGQGQIAQDNVVGAHMCNKNQNTMGICLLGNFQNIVPTPLALHALYELGGWKTWKEGIDPFGQTMHAIGPTSASEPDRLLPHIAGHRNGCSINYTECPGQKLYDLLPSIRDSIQILKSNCKITSFSENGSRALEQKIILSASQSLIIPYEATSLVIVDPMGREVGRKNRLDEQAITMQFPKGIYLFHFFGTHPKTLRVGIQ